MTSPVGALWISLAMLTFCWNWQIANPTTKSWRSARVELSVSGGRNYDYPAGLADEVGGRRRPVAGSKHVALRNDAFRAYADYMETHAFLAGVEELLVLAKSDSPTVMCSESLWW